MHLRSMAGERRGEYSSSATFASQRTARKNTIFSFLVFAGKKMNIPEKGIFLEGGLLNALPTCT